MLACHWTPNCVTRKKNVSILFYQSRQRSCVSIHNCMAWMPLDGQYLSLNSFSFNISHALPFSLTCCRSRGILVTCEKVVYKTYGFQQYVIYCLTFYDFLVKWDGCKYLSLCNSVCVYWMLVVISVMQCHIAITGFHTGHRTFTHGKHVNYQSNEHKQIFIVYNNSTFNRATVL